MKPDVGRPCFRAVSRLQPSALLEMEASSEGSEDGSNALRWWTRSQRIRTLAQVPLTVPSVEAVPAPIYVQIAGRARHLRGLGMTQEAIAPLTLTLARMTRLCS